jgi:glutamine amidotransferase
VNNFMNTAVKIPIYIIEYGVINTHAVFNLFKKTNYEVKLITSPTEVTGPNAIYILPGVGNFDQGMRSLNSSGFSEHLKSEHRDGAKILGICLGFQMLGYGSLEGTELGLGLLNGNCRSIQELEGVKKKVNNGWRKIENGGQLGEIQGRYYFTHSFGYSANQIESDNHSLFTYRMQGTDIVAGVMGETIAGFQFHPERSHVQGLTLIQQVIDSWVKT